MKIYLIKKNNIDNPTYIEYWDDKNATLGWKRTYLSSPSH